MNMINKIIDAILRFLGIGGGMAPAFATRESTIRKNNELHDMYDEILNGLGDLKAFVSKRYIYEKIAERTKLSVRHIYRVLLHTKKENLYD